MTFPLRVVAVFCAVVFCFVGPSHQEGEDVPPKFVYRTDFRDPQDMFSNGLKAHGRNEDLMEHVDGESCAGSNKLTSAFVATTSSEAFAKRFGSDSLWSGSKLQKYFYVYKIRATKDFYNAYNSLMHGYQQTNDEDYKDTADFFRHEFEWVAHKGVPRNLIESAAVYERGKYRVSLNLVRIESNPHYKDAETRASDKNFPVKGKGLIGHISLLASSIKVSSCFKSCPGISDDEPVESTAEDSVNTTCPFKSKVFQTTINAQTATVWDPIAGRPVERLVPWKEEVKIENGLHYTEKPADCSITSGSANDEHPILKIHCPRNRFYEKFVVKLKAGLHASFVRMVDKNGVAGHPWNRSAREIVISGQGTLQQQGHRIDTVFSGTGSPKWWSRIKIFPIFPAYHSYESP